MNKINVEDIINGLKLKETLIHAFSNKLNCKPGVLSAIFDKQMSLEIDKIGDSLNNDINNKTNISKKDISTLKDLSIDDFLKDNTVIKDN